MEGIHCCDHRTTLAIQTLSHLQMVSQIETCCNLFTHSLFTLQRNILNWKWLKIIWRLMFSYFWLLLVWCCWVKLFMYSSNSFKRGMFCLWLCGNHKGLQIPIIFIIQWSKYMLCLWCFQRLQGFGYFKAWYYWLVLGSQGFGPQCFKCGISNISLCQPHIPYNLCRSIF